MMKKVVMLNCPPRSGKDTIAEEISKTIHCHCGILSFKYKLIEIALTVSGIQKSEWDERYCTVEKEQPWNKLGGLSQRNYLIKISEEWVKPVHGKTYFGDRVLEDVLWREEESFIIPDGGFKEEVLPLYSVLSDGLLILQWGREGCSFENDSRDYVMDYPEITRRIRDNNSSIQDQVDAVRREIIDYYGEEL